MKSLKLAALIALGLAGCSNNEVSFATLESARLQAKENAEFNAKAWRAQADFAAELSLISKGDSSQEPDCPQGDGWATLELVDGKTGKGVAKLKCSTVSLAVGCRLENDFKKSQYSSEDGRCQPTTKVPFPLPKIAK